MTSLEQTIGNQIRAAMLSKNTDRLRALRGIKSTLDLLNTSGKEITEDIQLTSLQKMVKTRKESADIYKNNNRLDLFEVETSEISVIEEFLPKQLTKEEIELIVKSTILELGATNMRDMGKVIGSVNKQLAGKADGKIISEIVKTLLA
jgi:uncharacterized protein YqeY